MQKTLDRFCVKYVLIKYIYAEQINGSYDFETKISKMLAKNVKQNDVPVFAIFYR